MSRLSKSVLQISQAQFKNLQKWRRRIHQYPELGFLEKKTAALISDVLIEQGWKVQKNVAKTGVVAMLPGRRSGKCLAIRADMDALPIEEQSKHSYCSKKKGVMHACGHDGNTTIALGAAVILQRFSEKIDGQIKLIFQPCEEQPPGGAQEIIKAGALEKPKPDLILAGHMDAGLPCGTIGIKDGIIMANADAFTLTVIGKGGHGAIPHKSIDPIVIAAQIINNLQMMISRERDPLDPQVLTIGQIHGGSTYNVIADHVVMQGTLRSLTSTERKQMPLKVKHIAKYIAQAHNAKIRFEFESGHPALENNKKAAALLRIAGEKVLGSPKVVEFKRPLMTGEDFTYYSKYVPACFFHVGGGNKGKGFNYPWHHPKFDFDEQALVYGSAVLAQAALDYLSWK